MTATATAPATDARVELRELTAESAKLRAKLDGDKKTLAELVAERGRINEAIAAGTAKAERAGEIARRIEAAQAAVDGGTALLSRVEKRQAIVQPIAQRLAAAEQLAAHRAELAKLKADGEAICAKINERLTAILTEDFPALDGIRDRMTREYVGQGLEGPLAANRLINLLVRSGVLVAETAVRKSRGWGKRSDIQLPVHNLRPKVNRWP